MGRMRGRWLGVVMVAWSAAGLLCAAVAVADTPAQGLHARANQLGMVVSAGEVYIAWRDPPGHGSAKVLARRGHGACPRTPADGVSAGAVFPFHVVDRTVKAGVAYCYTVFLQDPGGELTTIGSTGALTVPNLRVVPHAQVKPPAPVPATTRFNAGLARMTAVIAGGALVAVILLFAIVRATRVSGRPLLGRPAAPGSLVEHSSALVVPLMIAIGWVGIVVWFVVLR